ncbi:MAG: DUF6457 domain-containing protein [Dermatophilaceae bacterium]
MLEEWLAAVQQALGMDTVVDSPALLDLTREVAHGVDRPAAPLTTYLLGYHAALHQADPAAEKQAIEAVTRLAQEWSQRST